MRLDNAGPAINVPKPTTKPSAGAADEVNVNNMAAGLAVMAGVMMAL